jgi:dihydroorotate dehydrogenase electron transfer subunit
MDDIEGVILENTPVCGNYYRCRVRLTKPMGRVAPGQFVMVKIPSSDIFLRRPFSIYESGKQVITILYKIVGKGTGTLASATRRERVMLLGPLGHGFRVQPGYTPVLVAGGIGIAGLQLLWKQLKNRAVTFYGCSTKEEVSLLGGIAGGTSNISTLDGSVGFEGNVVELLSRHLERIDGRPHIYACGPEPMYSSLKLLLAKTNIPCQVLVEERMACGLGLCFGCVKKTIDEIEPYKRACIEGPVFDLWQLSL